jgi:hypothetical protein
MRNHFLVSLALVLGALLINSEPAQACSCAAKPTVLDSYNGSEVVIVARAVALDKSRTGYLGVGSTRMVVESVFKGLLRVGEEIRFVQGGGADCVLAFNEESINRQFLFYLGGPSPFRASICGRSNRVDNADDDLLYLLNREKMQGRTRISGSVRFRDGSNVPLSGRKIRINGPRNYVVDTDSHGTYEVYDAPPGRYLISPDPVPGWKVDVFYNRYSPSFAGDRDSKYEKSSPIMVEAGKHAALDLVFEIDNSVAGKIFDPAGNPMYAVCLALISTSRVEDRGADFSCSDKEGAFSINSVPVGTYLLAVNRTGIITSDEPFRTFYYPGVAERTSAKPITIGAGQNVYLQISVPKVEETVTVRGRVLYSDRKPVSHESIEFKANRSEAFVNRDARTTTDAEGRFAIRILKGSTGILLGSMFAYIGEFLDCPELEKAIRRSGDQFSELKTSPITVRAEKDLTDIEFAFPFPGCTKAKTN